MAYPLFGESNIPHNFTNRDMLIRKKSIRNKIIDMGEKIIISTEYNKV